MTEGPIQPRVTFVPIDRDGAPRGDVGELSEAAREVLRSTAAHYSASGFVEPWICYLALSGEVLVGTCGFKAAPNDGRVEIAYFTFPEFEGRRIATAMAGELLAIARRSGTTATVAAQTLAERNASHRVLERLGFRHVDTIEHTEDGTIWEWRLEEPAE